MEAGRDLGFAAPRGAPEDVHERVRDAILNGDMAPGLVISQVALAKAFGVSTTPLREAVRMLQREGLVEAERNRRVRITPLSVEDMDELYCQRILLECALLRLALPAMTDDDIAELEGCVAQMGWYADQQNYAGWQTPHRLFHAGLAGRVPLLPGTASLRGLGMFTGMLGAYEFGGIHPRLPSRTFASEDSIEVGGRAVELIYVGPAHTTGDAMAWIPDVRVVFTGDIIFNGVMPIMWAGPVETWIAALDRIVKLDPEVVLGGHGPPAGIDEVRALREYWTWLRGEVGEAGDQDAGELTERLIRSDEWSSSPWGGWSSPERTLVNVARMRSTSAGGSSEIGTVERMKLIGGMGALAERLRD